MEQTNNQPAWFQIAEVELVYRTKVKASKRPSINGSKDCYKLSKCIWNEERIEMQEEFKVLLLNGQTK